MSSNSAALTSLLASIDGPLVLVGYSCGGMLISNAASGNAKLRALVSVAAFSPEAGESAAHLAGRFPGGTLGETLTPVPLPQGDTDLYIQQERFRAQFAADVPERQARLMVATQRPVTKAALNEPAIAAAWQNMPSWFVFGGDDKNIPLAALRFVAERAQGREIVEVAGGFVRPRRLARRHRGGRDSARSAGSFMAAGQAGKHPPVVRRGGYGWG